MFRRRCDLRNCRGRWTIFLVLVFMSAVVWLALVIGSDRPELVQVRIGSTKPWKSVTRSRKQAFTKQFLAWTTKSGRSKWIPNNLRTLGCSTETCRITEDRSQLSRSDVVIFHSKDVVLSDLPQTRRPGQLWVYLNHEPPTQTTYSVVEHLAPLVNLTITYRTDSDIFAPVYDLRASKSAATGEFTYPKKNRKLVTWLVSHCKTSSNREGYVKKLKEFIDVDVWGKCGKNFTKCPKLGREQCYEILAKEYMFYLAFENSLCKDYISEKLYLAMYAGMVPVVFGATNYSRFLPENSFINALDFKGPKELATFLMEARKDESLYHSFLEWKQSYTVIQRRYKWLCDLCALVHDNQKEIFVSKEGLTKWWFDDAKCTTWSENFDP